jgi:hypothetical protein
MQIVDERKQRLKTRRGKGRSMNPGQKILLAVASVLLLLGSISLVRVIEAQVHDWHWTHKDMKLSLASGKDTVEIYIHNRPLNVILSRGELRLTTPNGEETLAAESFSLRLNKFCELTRLDLVLASLLLTTGALLFIFALVLSRARRGNGEGDT